MGKPFRILTCQGIGDSVWAVFKMQDIARKYGSDWVEILVAGWDRNDLETRAIPLLRQFDFVSDVRFYEMPKGSLGPMLLPGEATDEKGRYRYIPDGKPPFWLEGDVDFVAVSNRALENGIRLEDWLPEYEIDWDPFCLLRDIIWETIQPRTPAQYVVFYLGSEGANSEKSRGGHNRGALWTPEQWAELGDKIVDEFLCEIVVVGAGYDSSYYKNQVEPLVRRKGCWHNRIAEFTIFETLKVCENAKTVVSYQSGIGIMSHYLGKPTVMWWRPEGDSIIEGANVTFSEEMATAWTYPGATNYKPCIYGRESVEDILNWLKAY